ncbi:right-handed parallel beta-helix repeat-containing protein [candidate division WOR-3 bacterium]|nr:right-handed parallel beta-helix repeat-containing protein [candidate division WOR-3 bacterium]
MIRKVLRYLFIVLFLFSSSISATVRHIYESDGAQAIQDSIDVSGELDIVMVHNGKYYIGDLGHPWGLDLKGRQLMSVSPDSAPCCTLSGLNSSGLDTARHVIWDTLSSISWCSLIQGFTITEGKGFGNISAGGGIYLRGYQFFNLIFIQDNIITENAGGILVEWSTGPVIIQHNHILNNSGCGIIGWGSQSLNIKNNLIKGNVNEDDGVYQDGIGGGIFLESGFGSYNEKVKRKGSRNGNKIENNLIINNYAEICGGGIGFGFHIGGELNGNCIALNEAREVGGGIFSQGGSLGLSKINGAYNNLIANRSDRYGSFSINVEDSTSLTRMFVVDNGSFSDSSGSLGCWGGVFFEIRYSNIYYNTYQKDIEVAANTIVDTTSLENNFWWVTDSASIDSLIDGPADFIPFEMGFVPDAPGEPVEIYSVLNYSSDYSSIIDSIGGDPDTLYLEITGHDRNPEYKEAAVAILKSNIYPTGIAVALLETDTASGIYRGEAIVETTNPPDSIRMDDIYQIIRVSSDADTVRIFANMDTTEIFRVYYRCHSGIKEDFQDDFLLESLPNPVLGEPEFRFFLPIETKVELNIYDTSGRLINNVLSKRLASGWHSVTGRIEKSGIYFYWLKTQIQEKTGKIVVVK